MRSRRWVQWICWAMLAASLCLFQPLMARLPVVNDGLAAARYNGWAGVLRVWVVGGWAPGGGSFVPWLNACAATFEKRNPGVYLQIESVSEAMMREFASDEINPPDAILFPPGFFSGAAGLMPVDMPDAVRASLQASGAAAGGNYAIPVAVGGYAWALNTAMLNEVPVDWGAAAQPTAVGKQQRFLLNIPADEPYHSWSAAMVALMTPVTVLHRGEAQVKAGEGIDLGLPEAERIKATPEPEIVEAETVVNHLPEKRPGDFRKAASVFEDFVNGRVAAVPVTQREVRRLQVLGESGRGPDWTVLAGGGAFSDQVLYYGVVDWPRPDAEARQGLAAGFGAWLLGEASQEKLTIVRAFRATAGPALYAGQAGMDTMEWILDGACGFAPAFGDAWRSAAAREADRMVREADAGTD